MVLSNGAHSAALALLLLRNLAEALVLLVFAGVLAVEAARTKTGAVRTLESIYSLDGCMSLGQCPPVHFQLHTDLVGHWPGHTLTRQPYIQPPSCTQLDIGVHLQELPAAMLYHGCIFLASQSCCLPVAQVAEALLGGHDVAELVTLSQRALDGSRMEVVLAAASVDVRQLPLVAQPLRLVDVVGAAGPLQGGLQVPPVLQQLQGCTNACRQTARLIRESIIAATCGAVRAMRGPALLLEQSCCAMYACMARVES